MTAQVSLCRIALSLVAYRDRHGSYPNSLNDLRAKLGWEIPEDPFSGKDFKYRREGEDFLLYSIGSNLRDDGGGITPWPSGDILAEERKDDIVWDFAP